jgi:hypothetical protein
MLLTESQIQFREEQFYYFLEEVAKDYYAVDTEYEMTEEDAYIASILLDYFVENYKQPTINEAAYESLSGISINQDLVNEMLEVMLDESLGRFVAGAAHGIRNLINKHRLNKATKKSDAAHAAEREAKSKVISAQKKAKSSGSGLIGSLKKAYYTGKANSLEKKHEKAIDKYVSASNKKTSALKAHQAGLDKQSALKKKIDTGVENIKKKAVSKITPGASKITGLAGRVSGALG